MHNFYETPNKTIYGKTEHPTEKPLNLIEHLVEIHSNEDDCVLDCFMGSGTTGVACHQTNRNFIGIELEPKYYEIAKERIKEAKAQRRLI
jgi:site-specific DNA-methyltransferase (adenine-specific)